MEHHDSCNYGENYMSSTNNRLRTGCKLMFQETVNKQNRILCELDGIEIQVSYRTFWSITRG